MGKLWGVFVMILEKMDRVITTPHCTMMLLICNSCDEIESDAHPGNGLLWSCRNMVFSGKGLYPEFANLNLPDRNIISDQIVPDIRSRIQSTLVSLYCATATLSAPVPSKIPESICYQSIFVKAVRCYAMPQKPCMYTDVCTVPASWSVYTNNDHIMIGLSQISRDIWPTMKKVRILVNALYVCHGRYYNQYKTKCICVVYAVYVNACRQSVSIVSSQRRHEWYLWNNRQRNCLLHGLFGLISKTASMFRIIGTMWRESTGTRGPSQ